MESDMKRRIISTLLTVSLLFGCIGVNAASISFENIHSENTESSISYEKLETEENIQNKLIQDNISTLPLRATDENAKISFQDDTEQSNSIQAYSPTDAVWEFPYGVSDGTATNGTIQASRTYFSSLWHGTFNFNIQFKMQN